jgi:cell division protease FtsH
MGQFPQQPPLEYIPSGPDGQGSRGRFGRGLFGWLLFLGLAAMLFMLLSKKGDTFKLITLDDFVFSLERKEINSVVIDGDEISGHMDDGRGYRTALPAGLAGNWSFIQWLLATSKGTASVEVRNPNNLVINILLPLIPWLLIFGFIWFFVFRQLRSSARTQQMLQQMSQQTPQQPFQQPPPA